MRNNTLSSIVAITVVKIVTMVNGILQAMILVRMLSKAEFGLYSQSIMIYNLISIITSIGLSEAVIFFCSKKTNDEANVKFKLINLLTIILNIVMLCVVLLFRNNISEVLNSESLGSIIFLICLRTICTNVNQNYQSIFIVFNKGNIIAIRNLFVSVLQTVCIVFIAKFSNNVFFIFLGLLIVDVIQLLYLKRIFKFCNLSSTTHRKFKLHDFLEVLKYSTPLWLSMSVGIFNKELDKIFINLYYDIEKVAEYSNMTRDLPLSFAALSISTVLMPKLIKHINDSDFITASDIWKIMMELGSMITWAIGFAVLLVSRTFLVVLYTDEYLSGISIFQIYVLVQMMKFTYFGAVISSFGKTHVILKISISAFLINIVLNYIFLIFFGYIGAIIATLVSVFFLMCSQLVVSNYYFKKNLINLDYKFIAIILLKLILVFFVSSSFRSLLMLNLLNVFFIDSISLLFYLIFSFIVLNKTFANSIKKLKKIS